MADHHRVDSHGDLATGHGLLGDGHQLDDMAEPAGEVDVGQGERADALVVDVAGHDLLAEGDRGQDGRLGSGVEALHIGGGVALGEAEALGLRQRILDTTPQPRSCG